MAGFVDETAAGTQNVGRAAVDIVADVVDCFAAMGCCRLVAFESVVLQDDLTGIYVTDGLFGCI